jgi:predicted RNA-binding Zn-ribbon protein involved in translation (DUF1610 family)
MKIRCTNCNAAYAVDDGKVEGKKFGFECPKCGVNVVIDNRDKTPAGSPAKESIVPATEREIDVPDSFEMPAETPAGSSESDLPSFGDMPFSEDGDDTIGSLPSFDESGLELASSPASGSEIGEEEAFNYDNFEDEIEPEIDLSVLEPQTTEEPAAEKEEDILSSAFSAPLVEEDLSVGLGDEVETIADETGIDEDESITIDLDSLDIDLAEPEEVELNAADTEFSPVAEMEGSLLPEESASEGEEEDESITLDLDSLDIALEESDEIHPSESPDEDEGRLSLGDAGLSIDDIEASDIPDDDDNENLSISLDDVSGGFALEDDIENAAAISGEDFADEIGGDVESYSGAQSSLAETYTPDMLPEVDLDRYGIAEMSDHETIPSAPVEDRFLDIESQKDTDRFDKENSAFSPEKIAASGGGFINFSVDYAFRYSRLKALLRLLGVYYITFIPHLVVCGIYSAIAGVTGTINWLIILFSGEREKDFSLMQEQSIRYAMEIYSSMLNVTEDKPSFAGKKDIDYQLQFSVVYPPKYSRVLAFLRLTGVGIFIAALPHILLLSVLSIGMVLICFASLVFTLVTGHWPSLTFDFMVRYLRYCANIAGYVYGLVDTYPSFRFE